ncbi:MAG: restriction endonuclease subunit S [Thermoguttaceae bacterium]|nr:restriction endonuclease subunit S [Thermoguttaceae bacterium]
MKARLGDYIREYSQRNKADEDIPVYSVTNTQGFCQGFFDKEVASKDKSNYKIVPWGCFAYNPSRINVGSVDWQRNEERVIVSPLYNVFSVLPGLDRQYLYYYLKSDPTLFYIKEIATGSVRDNLKLAMLYEFEINLPSEEEQRHIVRILDQVSAIQAARQKQLRALDELVKARFIEMFGDKDSEMKPLIVVCGFIDYRGKTPQKSEKGIPLITAKNVKDEGFSVSPQEFIPEENYEQVMTRGIPQINDVLFTTEAPLGNVCRIPPFLGKFCVGQRIITMHPKEELLTSEYLEFALRSKEFQNAMWQQSSGSTVKGIRSALLEKIKIPVPSMNLQISFSKLVRQVDHLKSKLRESLTQTETLFNSLMQQYFG